MSTDRRPWPSARSTDEDWAAFLDVDAHAFGRLGAGRAARARARGSGAGPQHRRVRRRRRWSGIATAYSFDLTVPGAAVPAAGVSWVGVLPTHRRRGVLRALMDHQLGACTTRGREPSPSSGPPSRRSTAGSATGWPVAATAMTVPRSASALRPGRPADPGLRLRLVPADDWKLTAGVYDTLAGRRPGMFARDERWWKRAVSDLPDAARRSLRAAVRRRRGRRRASAATPATRPSSPSATTSGRARSRCAR